VKRPLSLEDSVEAGHRRAQATTCACAILVGMSTQSVSPPCYRSADGTLIFEIDQANKRISPRVDEPNVNVQGV
jgi:hypothetical protein